MPKTIQQTVDFSASPETLFDIYLDSKKHSAAINSRAVASRKVGGKFLAFHGALRGRNLSIIPKRMIVQSWRASGWKKADLDSILVLTFSRAPRGGRIALVHANIPDKWHAMIRKGWNRYYWKPWKVYLKARSRKR